LKKEGLYDVIEIGNREKSLEYNMTHAARLLQDAVTKYFS
jgi:hypothetical protein